MPLNIPVNQSKQKITALLSIFVDAANLDQTPEKIIDDIYDAIEFTSDKLFFYVPQSIYRVSQNSNNLIETALKEDVSATSSFAI